MGLSLKKITKGIGKIGTNIGKAVKKGAKDTWNEVKRNPEIYGTAAGILTGGLGGAIGGAVAKGVSKIPGVAKVGGAVKKGAEAIGSIPGIAKASGGISFDNILGAAGTVDAAIQRRKATDLENQGLNRIRTSYDSRAPLRQMGLEGLMRPEGSSDPRLASVYRVDRGNPYASQAAPVPQQNVPDAGGFPAPQAPPPVVGVAQGTQGSVRSRVHAARQRRV